MCTRLAAHLNLFLFLAVAFIFIPSPAPAAELYFPPAQGEWEKIDPAKTGWNDATLAELDNYLCTVDSTGFVIILDGRLLHEKICALPDKDAVNPHFWLIYKSVSKSGQPVEDVASTQKSVTAFLIGVAEGKKLLSIEDPVSKYLGEGWSKASPEQEKAIKIRHLLAMASGLKEDLSYEAPAGSYWYYNSPAYSRLSGVLEKAGGRPLPDLATEWLLKPVGMNESHWVRREGEYRAAVPWGNLYGFNTTPRDLARFGLLVLNKGVWAGKDLLNNPGYIEKLSTPAQKPNEAYGYLWWLNGSKTHQRGGRSAPETENGAIIPNAPADLIAAFGAMDRRIYVVPSASLVFTRTGAQAGGALMDFKIWYYLNRACGRQTAQSVEKEPNK
jgi:CubicO group peptidase (beta-lactamase class C family)